MKISDIKSARQIDVWIASFNKDIKLIEGAVEIIADPECPSEYLIKQKNNIFNIKLRDAHQKPDLDHFIKTGNARVAYIIQVAKENSALLSVHFFNGQLIELGEVEVGIDNRIAESAKRSGFKFNNIDELSSLLKMSCSFEIGDKEISGYFLLTAGPAAENDLKELVEDDI